MKVIASVDDLDYAEHDGKQTAATETRRLTYGRRRVELDLTAEHAKELDDLLERYLTAGRQPPTTGTSRPVAAVPSHAKMSRAEAKALREWADAEGINYRPAGPDSGPYYSIDLRRRWAAHKEAEGLSFD